MNEKQSSVWAYLYDQMVLSHGSDAWVYYLDGYGFFTNFLLEIMKER